MELSRTPKTCGIDSQFGRSNKTRFKTKVQRTTPSLQKRELLLPIRTSLSMASSFITLAKPFTSHKPNIPSLSNKTFTGFQRSSLRVKAVAKKYEPTKVVPQADRVLIRLEELSEKSAGGVLLPKAAVKFERYLVGEVLSVGAEVGEVETGKKVLFADVNAYEVDLGTDGRHCFCKAGDLLAVVE